MPCAVGGYVAAMWSIDPTPDEVQQLVETRRDLHRHPELGFEEHRTAGVIAERLRSLGYIEGGEG